MAEKHSVGIKYTGINGGVTAFNASSVDDAFRRLSAIKGYMRSEGDNIAAQAAQTLNKRAQRVRDFRDKQNGVPNDQSQAYRTRSDANGNNASIRVITDIKIGRWGHVDSITYGKVHSDNNGGFTVENEGAVSTEHSKWWEEYYKNWNTLWTWWGNTGRYLGS